MAKHWNPLLWDAVEANSIHAFKKGLGKFMENGPHSDCKHSGNEWPPVQVLQLSGGGLNEQMALWLICFLYCFS